jgi:hypothetical protein
MSTYAEEIRKLTAIALVLQANYTDGMCRATFDGDGLWITQANGKFVSRILCINKIRLFSAQYDREAQVSSKIQDLKKALGLDVNGYSVRVKICSIIYGNLEFMFTERDECIVIHGGAHDIYLHFDFDATQTAIVDFIATHPDIVVKN